MNKTKKIVVTILVSLFAFSSSLAANEIRMSAPASMTDAMKELSEIFAQSGQHAKVIVNSGASGTLAKQIAEGAPVDVFVSANQKWMRSLRDTQKIVPGTEKILASNSLVFVGTKNPSVTQMADLAALKLIAIGSPKSVPAGEYAAQALTQANLYSSLEQNGKLVMAADVRQALTYAERGEIDGAFVYRTDALMARQAVVLFEVPQTLYDRIVYPLALTVEGDKNPEARAFYNFLLGEQATQIFLKYGFGRTY